MTADRTDLWGAGELQDVGLQLPGEVLQLGTGRADLLPGGLNPLGVGDGPLVRLAEKARPLLPGL
jgi:hypothetical protein